MRKKNMIKLPNASQVIVLSQRRLYLKRDLQMF